jgi:hypothetical protein
MTRVPGSITREADSASTAQQAKSIRPKFRYLQAMKKISEKTASQI